MKRIIHTSIIAIAVGSSAAINAQNAPPPNYSLSQEELDALAKELDTYIASLTPEQRKELEDLGRSMMKEMGLDPETGQPLQEKSEEPSPTEERAPEPAPKPETPPLEKQPTVEARALEDVHALLSTLIAGVTDIRHKASILAHKRLTRWKDDLTDLVYKLKILHQPAHHARLALPEHSKLKEALQRLQHALAPSLEQLATLGKSAEELLDPYELLGISADATPKEIEAAYQEINKTKSPEAINNALKTQGVTQEIRDVAVQEAQLTFAFIQDAYDRLKDPALRALIDKERTTRLNAQQSSLSQHERTIDRLTKALSDAFFQDQLMTLIDEYLKGYEPHQEALRKKLAAEEAERLKEQKGLAEIKPATPVGKISRPGHRPHYPLEYGRPGGGAYYPHVPGYEPADDHFFGNVPEQHARGAGTGAPPAHTAPGKTDKKQGTPLKTPETEPKQEKKEKKREKDTVTQEMQLFGQKLAGLSNQLRELLTRSKAEIGKGAQDLEEEAKKLEGQAKKTYDTIKMAAKEKYALYAQAWAGLEKEIADWGQQHTRLQAMLGSDATLVKHISAIQEHIKNISTLLPQTRTKTADAYTLVAQAFEDLGNACTQLSEMLDINELKEESGREKIASLLQQVQGIATYVLNQTRRADARELAQYKILWKDIAAACKKGHARVAQIAQSAPEKSGIRTQAQQLLAAFDEIEKRIGGR